MASPFVPSPSPVSGASEIEPSATKIEALGVKLEIPLPRWAVASLAVLIIAVGVGAAIYFSVSRVGGLVMMARAQVEVYEETNFHLTEPKQLKESKEEAFADLTTTVTINYFKSDGCVQIVRWNQALGKGDGLWMFGEHPQFHNHVHAESPRASSASGLPLPLVSVSHTSGSFQPIVDAREAQPFRLVQGGRCLDPHPGNFSVENRRIDQCNIQVWRTFSDSCVHYQIFNACTGAWDVLPNGAPRVSWVRCIHSVLSKT